MGYTRAVAVQTSFSPFESGPSMSCTFISIIIGRRCTSASVRVCAACKSVATNPPDALGDREENFLPGKVRAQPYTCAFRMATSFGSTSLEVTDRHSGETENGHDSKAKRRNIDKFVHHVSKMLCNAPLPLGIHLTHLYPKGMAAACCRVRKLMLILRALLTNRPPTLPECAWFKPNSDMLEEPCR